MFATARDATAAHEELKRWINWARRARLPSFKRLGKTRREHLDGILEYFRTGLSNGYVEAMNGLSGRRSYVPEAAAPIAG